MTTRHSRAGGNDYTTVDVQDGRSIELCSFRGSRLALTLKIGDKEMEPRFHMDVDQAVEVAAGILRHIENVRDYNSDRRKRAETLLKAVESVIN